MSDTDKAAAAKVIHTKAMNAIRDHVVDYSILKAIGTVKDKEILNIGCGDGTFCHTVAEQGAKKVVGIGMAKPLVDMAEQSCKVADVESFQVVESTTKVHKLGEFDIVVSQYTMQHIREYGQLTDFAQSAFDNLKPGGVFCGSVTVFEPIIPKKGVQNMCNVAELSWDLSGEDEFSPVDTVLAPGKLSEDNPGIKTHCCRLYLGTPEKVLKEVGYVNVERKDFDVSDKGKAEGTDVFSREHEKEPYMYLFIGTKPES